KYIVLIIGWQSGIAVNSITGWTVGRKYDPGPVGKGYKRWIKIIIHIIGDLLHRLFLYFVYKNIGVAIFNRAEQKGIIIKHVLYVGYLVKFFRQLLFKCFESCCQVKNKHPELVLFHI